MKIITQTVGSEPKCQRPASDRVDAPLAGVAVVAGVGVTAVGVATTGAAAFGVAAGTAGAAGGFCCAPR